MAYRVPFVDPREHYRRLKAEVERIHTLHEKVLLASLDRLSVPHVDPVDHLPVDDRSRDQQPEAHQVVRADRHRNDDRGGQRQCHEVHGEDVGDNDFPLAPQLPLPGVQSQPAAPQFDALQAVAHTH